jgi:uncharacterized protein YndB with AHSA1/START domain
MKRSAAIVLALGLAVPGVASSALLRSSASGFVVEHKYRITAEPAAAWQVLVHPERWWPSAHTWSGDASHLSLTPEAGGCFCERWADGSVEHGHVVHVRPGRMLRFVGALGPLQDMGVSAALTVALAPVDGGTEATVTYRVSGDAAHALDQIAPVVDQVIGQQFGGFAALASKPATP